MSPLSELVKAAAVTTAKGAGITLASTAASCYLACQIEVRAHRVVYHYFPEKYANVEYASGLTQEQLDAAHEMKFPDQAVTYRPRDDIVAIARERKVEPVPEDTSAVNRFWKEENLSLAKFAQGFVMPSQEIIACSMTG